MSTRSTLPVVSPNLNGDISRKSLWLACYVSLLSRASPEEARELADAALGVCDKHWSDKAKTDIDITYANLYAYPVGYPFNS